MATTKPRKGMWRKCWNTRYNTQMRARVGLRYALEGFKIALREELNFRIQIIATIAVIVLGWFFDISMFEWIAVIFAIGLVLSAELLNTAFEALCDKFHADPDPHIAKIKDLAAGGVLVASTTASIIGLIVFMPHVTALFV